MKANTIINQIGHPDAAARRDSIMGIGDIVTKYQADNSQVAWSSTTFLPANMTSPLTEKLRRKRYTLDWSKPPRKGKVKLGLDERLKLEGTLQKEVLKLRERLDRGSKSSRTLRRLWDDHEALLALGSRP
ncbi:uncharacterized protein MYCFIDRAFT_211437 [Pseudocercospora fijiensis CIRAD86]|uniref:Uncharacterized protein n=1 Tax=Pseudocercospora fijiensis (strain CIRAD86) TaxID=383855 RepID=M2ZRM7_PSEFD|nr:uncharacterized protein MYCFIDRAFT_211437 [Pseudocercospora fijiensis CIRAD86]EME81694.1 hypothetical protein MYCFIDRAFT_211437 [Pseudocercospora fijiensis CIRAD86]